MSCLLHSTLRRCASGKCPLPSSASLINGRAGCVRFNAHVEAHNVVCPGIRWSSSQSSCYQARPCNAGARARAPCQAVSLRYLRTLRDRRSLSQLATEGLKEQPHDSWNSGASATGQTQQVVASAKEGGSNDRWWHIWKYWRVRLFFRALRVGALSFALFQTGKQAGIQAYAQDPRGMRQQSIRELLASMGAGRDGDQGVKKKDCKEARVVQRVLPRILQAALEETRCQEQEIARKMQALKEQGSEDKGPADELEAIRRVKRLLKMWPQDGFLILNRSSPNAFVSPVVPGLIFVHSGLFDTEHYVPVKDFSTLEPGTSLRMRVKEGKEYYMPDIKKSIKFKEAQIYSCEFVSAQAEDSSVTVRVVWSRGKKVHLCIPMEDVRKNWTYSVCETDEQLAMLLGHEISHVIHGHGLVSLLTVLGMAPALKYSIELPYSRQHEFEADATGLRIAARAGFHPHDAEGFFTRLDAYSKEFGESGKRSWNSTHPSHEDRIQRLENLEADAIKYFQASTANDPGFGRLPSSKQSGFLSGAITTIAVILVGGVLFSDSLW